MKKLFLSAAAAAVGLGALIPGAGNVAFMLMAPVARFGRRVERKTAS